MSYSAVSKFEDCPYSYWLSYVRNKKFRANRGMVTGTLFGKVIEQAHLGRDVDWAMLKRFHENLPFQERELIDEKGLTLVWRLWGMYAPDGKAPYSGIPEKKVLVWLPDRKAVPYQMLGYLDLERPQDNAVSEFKTSGYIDSPDWGWTQARVDDSDQATLYWYAYGLEHDREPDEVRFHALGTKEPLVYRELVTKPNMDRLLKFQEKAVRLVEAIETETFPCTDGKCVRLKGA